MCSVFDFDFTRVCSKEIAMSLRRDFEVLNNVETDRLETSEVGQNAVLHYETAISLWGPGSRLWWSK